MAQVPIDSVEQALLEAVDAAEQAVEEAKSQQAPPPVLRRAKATSEAVQEALRLFRKSL